MLRLLTAGESHGRGLVAILDGFPAGVPIDAAAINAELKRRQMGFGRGKRMQIESDSCQIISGVRKGKTSGGPIALLVENRDFRIDKIEKVICPRPDHADLAGLLKYGFDDIRDVLERASARSTAATVAAGAVCKQFLAQFKIIIASHVISIGGEGSHEGRIRRIQEAMRRLEQGDLEARAEVLTSIEGYAVSHGHNRAWGIARFLEAHDEGCAPRVVLSATHQRALEIVPLVLLRQYAAEDT